MLTRLIYTSERSKSFTAKDIDPLLQHARDHNRRRDLTGMLVFDSRHFLQVLEGDRTCLNDLYRQLLDDPRHHRVQMLGMEQIQARLFGSWAMAFAPADQSRKFIYLRHGVSSRFEPTLMAASAALALLLDMQQSFSAMQLEPTLPGPQGTRAESTAQA